MAGALGASSEEAATIISRLGSMRLLVHKGTALTLTPEGRSYALRIIRVHRLWERYLSDETTIQESRWHEEAETQEHVMTQEEADALARRLGDPVFDPHGDPIPSSAGKIPRPHGKPLTSVAAGEAAGIVHVEDEPAVIYAQLAAQGLRPGVQVRVMDVAADRITLEADGNELVLAPVVAANVTVVPLRPADVSRVPHETLSSLRPGEEAVVRSLSPACRGLQRRRLMDLGVVPGTTIRAELESVSGDPVAYSVRGATIALRKEQADMIVIGRRRRSS
jgi:DtxR family Mn-dependent transcriptional regulator